MQSLKTTSIYEALKEKGIIFSNKPKKKAGYIMSDGSFLNFEDNKTLLAYHTSKEVTHMTFASFLAFSRITNYCDAETLLKTDNAIRFNSGMYAYIPEVAFIDLPLKQPTKEQFKSLLMWLDEIMFCSKKETLYYGFNGKRNAYEIKVKEVLPEDIIKEIRRHYAQNSTLLL